MAGLQLTDEQKSRLEFVVARAKNAEDGKHKVFRDKADRLLRRYLNYKELQEAYGKLDRPDRDRFVRSQDFGWGEPLTIPYAFSTVETILPRMLSNRPRMLILPRGQASERNVANMKYMIDSQQEAITYELVLQKIGKDGLITGLGIQKTPWRTKKRDIKQLERGLRYALIEGTKERIDFDGPTAERVDPRDFLWDPFADSIESCEWVVQRAYRSDAYIKKRMDEGLWTPCDLSLLTGGQAKYREIHADRLAAEGYDADVKPVGGLHEILEFSDGDQVITVIDREWVAVDGRNPYWHGEICFQGYRPTEVSGEFAGMGEIEPIEDLCREMDELRTTRRDYARMVLSPSFFYDDGSLDSADVKLAPGNMIPVGGNPTELLQQIRIQDIPNSGYQEEANLARDIERASGISDQTSGGSDVQQTATGAQLVQAAASVRIQNKTRRLEAETIKPGCQQWVHLNQQMIRSRREVRLPAAPTLENPNARWQWYEIGPMELMGDFEVECEGGATAPENTPQKRQDAQTWTGMLNMPGLDKRFVLTQILENMGVKQPEVAFAQDDPGIAKLAEAIKRIDPQAGPIVDKAAQYVMGAMQSGG